jgi:hypothetical protein
MWNTLYIYDEAWRPMHLALLPLRTLKISRPTAHNGELVVCCPESRRTLWCAHQQLSRSPAEETKSDATYLQAIFILHFSGWQAY